jgi:hypothetical protein
MPVIGLTGRLNCCVTQTKGKKMVGLYVVRIKMFFGGGWGNKKSLQFFGSHIGPKKYSQKFIFLVYYSLKKKISHRSLDLESTVA